MKENAHAPGFGDQAAGGQSTEANRRDDLLGRLEPLGVSGSYVNAAGAVVEVPTSTLELVDDHFRDEPPPGIGAPLVCTPGRHHPELFGDLVLEGGHHYRAHGVVDVPGYHVLHTDDGLRRFVIAAPVAYYGVTRWLENFAYRTPLRWWVFVIAFVAVAAVTLATVTFQNWRAANANPVKSIRNE